MAFFCEKHNGKQRDFDQRSFRWINRGKTRLLIGCKKGYWDDKRAHCRVGTRAYAVLTPSSPGARCPTGHRRIRK